MHSVENSNTFLAYYNHLDKYFAYVLSLTKYMPFTEKVQVISQKQLPVTSFVARYQEKLKYFGDLRNQLVHGFRLENKHYVLASDYAVEQIKTVYEEVRNPTMVRSLCTKPLYTCTTSESVQTVVSKMKRLGVSHVPLFDAQGKLVDVLSERALAYSLMKESDKKPIRIGDISLQDDNDEYIIISPETSLYHVEDYFMQAMKQGKSLWSLLITQTGDATGEVLGIITINDLPACIEHYLT